MKNKQLLALFLILTIIFSSQIADIRVNIASKQVSKNYDNEIVKNIYEEKSEYIINIYYPCTNCDALNEKIDEMISNYIDKVEKCPYEGVVKKLDVSFEEIYYEDYINYKFYINYNLGMNENRNEIKTFVIKNNNLITIEDITGKCSRDIFEEKLKEVINLQMDEKERRIDEFFKNDSENFLIYNNTIVLILNPIETSSTSSGIIEVEECI